MCHERLYKVVDIFVMYGDVVCCSGWHSGRCVGGLI